MAGYLADSLFSAERGQATEPVPWMLLVSPGHPRALAPGLVNVSNGPGVLCVPALSLSLLQDTVMSVGHRDKPGNLLPRHP